MASKGLCGGARLLATHAYMFCVNAHLDEVKCF